MATPKPPAIVEPPPADDEQDKLSDYIPRSEDISRAPSASATVSRVHSKAPSVDGEAGNGEKEKKGQHANGRASDGDKVKDEEEEGNEADDHEEDDDDDAKDEEDSDDGDEDELDADGDRTMASAASGSEKKSPSKTPRQMEKEREKAERSEARAAERTKRAEQNSSLSDKREKLKANKLADSLKRFGYLLGQTELFQHFTDLKKERDPEFKRLIEESQVQKGKTKAAKTAAASASSGGTRRRKTEKEEDEEMLKEEEDDQPFVFNESPPYVKGGTMRDYQIQGLNWMIGLFHNGINGILADEMGLGKTLQTISFLGYLKFYQDIPRFHLVVVPKSTLDNWRREFEHWVPGFNVVSLKGTKEERAELVQSRILTQDFDVLLTTYEMCLREKATLRKISWQYIVIDEAHRIKNVDSMLSQIVRTFDSRARLLITGTPLQNNLMELWSLLNFLLPDVFSNSEDFESWFKGKGDEAQDQVVQQLHKVLRPFLLRRVKADVEKSLLPKKEINVFVGLTDMQRKWYKSLLEKDIDAVNGAGGKKEGKTRLLNIVMQLRKCCNHPYLFDGAEPGPPFTTDEHLVFNSGKMSILDKLLKSMKEKGSRVLIFSQMSRMLDILEDYCLFREYEYCRIDGNTAHEDRISAIDDYNRPGSEKFIFLLTTRAGGLGINLTTADIVVLFDSDWNPQADLQAMDRAHRIGQTKQVYVFRFVTDSSVEERILERAAQKLRLDQLVIQQGRAQQAAKAAQNKEDLVDMIQHGAERIINSKEEMTIDDDIDAIIAKGEERTQALQQKYADLGLDDLNNFRSETNMTWDGQDFSTKRGAGGAGGLKGIWIEPSKRERKQNYHVDAYYREALSLSKKPSAPRAPRAPRQVTINDYQFFPPRLIELQRRETAAFQRSISYKVPLREAREDEDPEAPEKERKEEQDFIDTAEPLTEEEAADKEQLAEDGFVDWSKRDFQSFIKGSERHGRTAYAEIAADIGEHKDERAVRAYAKAFWERYREIADHERLIQRIEEGERKLERAQHNETVLRKRVAACRDPIRQLKIVYNQSKGKSFSEEEDRFLLARLAHYGRLGELETYERIREDVRRSPHFRFDWFLKSRTALEMQRRCNSLVLMLIKEAEESGGGGGGGGADAANDGRGGAGRKRVSDALANGTSSRSATPQGAGGGRGKKARKT